MSLLLNFKENDVHLLIGLQSNSNTKINLGYRFFTILESNDNITFGPDSRVQYISVNRTSS